MQLAGELYDLNNDLTDSRRKMGRAMKYIAPRKQKQVARLESRPTYSTVDFEQAADSALMIYVFKGNLLCIMK